MTLSPWASGHALPGHVRSCSSTDIMNPELALSNNGAIELSITPFSQLFSPSTSYLHYSLFWLSLFFLSPLSLIISSIHAWKKALACCPFSRPIQPSLPPINAWIVFYVKLTLICGISAPSSFYLPFNPLSSQLAPLPKISVSCWPNERSGGEIKAKRMLPTSLPRMNASILLHFSDICIFFKKKEKKI